MERPSRFDVGIERLKNSINGKVALVEIPSVLNKDTVDANGMILEMALPEKEIFKLRYVPPNNVGHSCNQRNYVREEEKPIIVDSDLSYVIYDDGVETGETLRCAIFALKEQGVSEENVWFVGSTHDSVDIYCDRAKVFLDYCRVKFKN